jgi:putative transposase
MAEETGIRISVVTISQILAAHDIVLSRPQPKVSSPDPENEVKKAIEGQRDNVKPSEVFYYADDFNVSWLPTLKAMWSPEGQQVMIPTPYQPKKQYGIGGVNYHMSETVVIFRRCRLPSFCTLYWTNSRTKPSMPLGDNVNTHQDDKVEALVRATAGRLVLMYLPAYSPWLNPIEML